MWLDHLFSKRSKSMKRAGGWLGGHTKFGLDKGVGQCRWESSGNRGIRNTLATMLVLPTGLQISEFVLK